jgi:phage-related protein
LGVLWDWLYRILSLTRPFLEWLFQTRAGLITLAAALSVLVKIAAYRAIGQLAIAFRFLAGVLTVTNAAALITTATIGALILGIGLLIDDFMTFREGGDSFIGDLVAEFPALLEVVNGLIAGVSSFVAFWMQQWAVLKEPLGDLGASLWTLISTIGGALWPLVKMVFSGWAQLLVLIIPYVIPIINLFGTVMVGAIQVLIGVIGILADTFTFMFNSVSDNIKRVVSLFTWAKDNISSFLSMIAGAYEKVRSFFGFSNNAVNVVASNTGAPAPASSVAALGSTGGVLGNSTTNNSSNVTSTQITAPITVVSSDPAKAGESVRQELDRMNKTATRNGQSGVAL